MKFLKIIAILLIFIIVFTGNVKADNDRFVVVKGHFVTVKIEPILYEKIDGTHFYIHIIIENKTDQKIGVKLGKFFDIIFLNQWGMQNTEDVGPINERSLLSRELNCTEIDNLISSYQINSKSLAYISAKATSRVLPIEEK